MLIYFNLINLYIYVHVITCKYIYMGIYMSIYIYTCIICKYIYIYTYKDMNILYIYGYIYDNIVTEDPS